MGLLIKDLITLKKFFKQLIILVAFYVCLSFFVDMGSFLSGMIVVLFSNMVVTTLSYDEFAKWDKYALTMPITKSDIVLSKYVLGILFLVLGGILSMLVSFVFKGNFQAEEIVLTVLAVFSFCVFMLSFLLPTVFKLGVEKGRMFMILIYMVPVMLFVVGAKKFDFVLQLNEIAIIKIIICGLVVSFVLYIISFFISKGIYMKKEL